MCALIKNHTFIQKSNRSLSLQLLFSHISLSRTDIAEYLGITTAAMTAISTELLQTGLVVQDQPSLEEKRAGRKKAPLSLNYDWKYILAIDIHSYYINIAVTNLKGDLIVEGPSFAPQNESPEELVSRIAKECLSMLWQSSITAEQILGAGITIIGPVNQDEGIAIKPFRLYNEPIRLREFFEKEFPFPVAVESNVCAFLQSELLFTSIADYSPNILILKWGPGVGSAMSVNGQIYKGYHYQSTEIGHNLIGENRNRICNCGRTGCLEPYISTDTIAAQISEIINDYPDSILSKIKDEIGEPNRNNLNAFIDTKDAHLMQFLNYCASLLARTATNAIHTLCPDKLILMGDLFDRDDMMQIFTDQLYKLSPDLPRDLCLRNRTISESKYIGATATAIDQILLK